MKDGFIKVAAANAQLKVADAVNNAEKIAQLAKTVAGYGAKLLVMPELCITGATCGDLFLQPSLQNKAQSALVHLCHKTARLEMAIVVGMPIACVGKLFNCSVVIYKGKILGVVPKTNINENQQSRWFSAPPEKPINIFINGQSVSFARDMRFTCLNLPEFVFAIEAGADAQLVPDMAQKHSLAGAAIIAAPCAVPANASGIDFDYISANTKRLDIGYVFSNAGDGESTTDYVFGGEMAIAQAGTMLAKAESFEVAYIISEIDVQHLCAKRAKNTGIAPTTGDGYINICFDMHCTDTSLTRKIEKNPFEAQKNPPAYYEKIFKMQAAALAKRIDHIQAKKLLIGISGGLDSALAILASVRALKMLNRPNTDIIAVTMPCFGTTKRTKSNAEKLCEGLGVILKCVDIKKAVSLHFEDIAHNPQIHDTTYENAQARERTQVLMDMAGEYSGFVVGTGDLSELALGWATFNGDHMSMYGINAGIPKTLIRSLVNYEAQRIGEKVVQAALMDILATPVSPELLPTDEGTQHQKTEDLVGPYALHDFFLYNMLYNQFSPTKIYRLATAAFRTDYDGKTILNWLKVFYRRFFAQQFKRSCMPDGVRIFDFSLSPRGDLAMPSDAMADIWLAELDRI